MLPKEQRVRNTKDFTRVPFFLRNTLTSITFQTEHTLLGLGLLLIKKLVQRQLLGIKLKGNLERLLGSFTKRHQKGMI